MNKSFDFALSFSSHLSTIISISNLFEDFCQVFKLSEHLKKINK